MKYMKSIDIWILLPLFIFANQLSAQKIEVKKFDVLEKSQRVVSIRNDNNGNPCALIIVNSIGDNIEFENTYVVDVVTHEDEYWVYMAEGAKGVKIKQPGFLTKTITFKDYGVSSLKGSSCYRLIIQGERGMESLGTERQKVDSIYRQGWQYKGEHLSPVLKLIIKREALGGKKEAQIAMANICLFEKKNDSAVEWVKRIIEEGDTLCLEKMTGDLLFQYAISIPHPEAYEIKHSLDYEYLLGYIVGQLSLKDEYDNAGRLCMQAYKKGVLKALNEHNKYYQLAESISIEKLYELMANRRLKNIHGEYYNEFKLNMSYTNWDLYMSPIVYVILRELANRGSVGAKEKLIQSNRNLFGN